MQRALEKYLQVSKAKWSATPAKATQPTIASDDVEMNAEGI